MTHAGIQKCASLIAVLMLALLPFQFSWSAVAAYCMHDESSTAQAQHLGHHEHQHEAKMRNGQADKTSQEPTFDIDCSICHGAVSGPSTGQMQSQPLP